MKNKKAEGSMGTMGIIFVVFIGVIVGLVLLQAAAQRVGETAVQVTLTNGQYTAPANNSEIDLIGAELLSSPTVVNRTGAINYGANGGGNYTIYEGVSTSTGVKTIKFRTNTDGAEMAGKLINVSYTYGADGYVDDTGATAIIGLIIIFAALACAVIALIPTLRSGVLDMIGR